MAASTVFFYLFAITMVGSALMVIASRNPVHSVLFLVLAFVNASGLFVIVGAEFLALLLIIVYVGAVAVLFLFVVMMLDIDFAELRQGFLEYLPVGGLVGIILLVELVMVLGTWTLAPDAKSIVANPVPGDLTNTEALGRLIYTDYIHIFQAAGMLLLVAMIGAIVLTLHHRENVKRQNIDDQVARDPKDAVTLHDIKPGQGISS